MKLTPMCWLMAAALAFTVSGCRQEEPQTATAPPGAPPAGAPTPPPRPYDTSAPPAAGVSDAELSQRVKDALAANNFDLSEVAVNSRDGAVELRGLVDTAEQQAKAASVATDVKGVTMVKNRITVRP